MKFAAAAFMVLIVSALFPLTAPAADAPATQPAPPPYVFIMPPGMQQISLAGHTGVCPPEYAQIVRKTLENYGPQTHPTTTASTMLQRLAAARSALIGDMTGDLGLPADKVTTFLDGPLKKALQEIDALHANCHIIVCTQPQLTALMKTGWTAPMFYFNKIADQAIFEARITVNTGRKLDDMVIWYEVHPGDTDQVITDGITFELHNFDGGFAYGCSQEALLETRTQLVKFMTDNLITPLHLPTSQQWFGMGVLGTFSAKYAAILAAMPRSELAAASAADSQNNPILAGPLDILHEFDPNSIKDEYMPMYLDAVSRKGTRVVQKIVDKAGDPSIMEIIHSIQTAHPANNADLVKIIKDDTGIDITPDLLPPQT